MFVKIEDYESSLNIIVPTAASKEIIEKSSKILIDEVICAEIVKIKEGVFIAKDFIHPDIPEKKLHTATEEVYTVLTSDIHVGSKLFLQSSFDRFIEWLKGNSGTSLQREIAGRVKYIIIAGDLVDGIGVYPNQEKELAVDDIFEQYNMASKLIKEIPEHVEIIIIPGNHDATRQALPQPAIFKKYAESIYALNNVTMLGDPARLRLHGVNFLIYHGRSLDDIIGSVPQVTYLNLKEDITTAMEYFLKTRHLAPIYGSRTPIALEPTDNLVIDTPPDILHTGHVHVIGNKNYRGTQLVNSGTWQAQTEYQQKMGLLPTPGIVPMINLKTLRIVSASFY